MRDANMGGQSCVGEKEANEEKKKANEDRKG